MTDEEMVIRASLRDELTAPLKKIQREISATGTSAATAGRKASLGSRGFDKMAAGAARIGRTAGRVMKAGLVVGAAAFAGLAYWVGKGVTSLMRIEKIAAQTDAVIKSTGGAAGVTAKQVDGLAGRLEALTSVEAESITEGQNLLLTFTNIKNEAGKGNKIFNESTKIMNDMSVALGQDASSSAIQLGKALNDPVKGISALSRVGVSFTEQQKKQIEGFVASGDTMKAQKVILAELNKEFGGSAKALGKTDSGKIARFGHAVGTFQETVAGALAPTLGKLATLMVDKGVPALEKWGEGFNKNVVPAAQNGFKAIGKVYGAFKDGGVDAATRKIEKYTDTQGELTPIVDKVSEVLNDLGTIFTGVVVPAFGDVATATLGLSSPLTLLDNVVGFIADHTDLFRVALTALVIGLTAAKVATIAKTVVDKISLIWLKAHTVGTKTHTVVTIASTVATKAAAVAMKVLNAAMKANPIGLIITAIALLVAAFVTLYKKSETFRAIVDLLWGVLKTFGGWLKDKLGGVLIWLADKFLMLAGFGVDAFRFLVNAALTAFDGILNAAEKGLGWIPGIGGKIKSANDSFDTFKANTLGVLDGVSAGIDTARGKLDELTKPRHIVITMTDIAPGVSAASSLQDIGAGPGGDTSTRRGRGGNFTGTMAAHADAQAATGARTRITNAFTGGGGRGRGSGDHQAGRALDLQGKGLHKYGAHIRAQGGYAAFHGTGSAKHLHAVPAQGDTSRSMARPTARTGTGGGSTMTIADGAIRVEVVNPAANVDVSAAVAQGIRDYVRERQERA